MRTSIIVFLLLFVAHFDASPARSQQWKQLFEGGEWNEAKDIIAVQFLPNPNGDQPKDGYVATKWELHKTTNVGLSWTQVLDVEAAINDIFFLNPSIGFVGTSGRDGIRRTTDGGATWTKVLASVTAYSFAYHAPTDRIFASCWHSPSSFYSEDSGATWQPFGIGGGGFAFANDSLGILMSHLQPLQRTTDGGLSWQFTSDSIYGVAPFGINGTFFTVDHQHDSVLRSEDGGVTWSTVLALDSVMWNPSGTLRGDSSVMITQSGHEMWISRDEGRSWTGIGGPHGDVRFDYQKGWLTAGGEMLVDDNIHSGLWRLNLNTLDVDREKLSGGAMHLIGVRRNLQGLLLDIACSETKEITIGMTDLLGNKLGQVRMTLIPDVREYMLPFDGEGIVFLTFDAEGVHETTKLFLAR